MLMFWHIIVVTGAFVVVEILANNGQRLSKLAGQDTFKDPEH